MFHLWPLPRFISCDPSHRAVTSAVQLISWNGFKLPSSPSVLNRHIFRACWKVLCAWVCQFVCNQGWKSVGRGERYASTHETCAFLSLPQLGDFIMASMKSLGGVRDGAGGGGRDWIGEAGIKWNITLLCLGRWGERERNARARKQASPSCSAVFQTFSNCSISCASWCPLEHAVRAGLARCSNWRIDWDVPGPSARGFGH